MDAVPHILAAMELHVDNGAVKVVLFGVALLGNLACDETSRVSGA